MAALFETLTLRHLSTKPVYFARDVEGITSLVNQPSTINISNSNYMQDTSRD